MRISYDLMRERERSFDRVPHYEQDAKELCAVQECEYLTRVQKKPGYYASDISGDCIFIDSRISGYRRREVIFHEFSHLRMHCKCDFLEWRQQIEAEVFSIIYMIPLRELFEAARTPWDQLDHEKRDYYVKRLYIYEKYDI